MDDAARRLLEAASPTPAPARAVADFCAVVLTLALAAFDDRRCPCCLTGTLLRHLLDPDRRSTTAPMDTS